MDDAVGFQLLATMPMRFAGMVLENTNRCTAKCGMCYQSSGPKGSDVLGRAHLNFDVMARAIREARKIPTMTPRFHLAGGEAFMHLDECVALFEVAKDAGYLDITATSNVYWARSLDEALQTAQRLRDAGMTSMEISWDFWHMPYIKAENIGHALRACRMVGIETNLRVLTSKSHNLHEALSVIAPEDLQLADRITTAPVFATGRAASFMPPDEFHTSGTGIDANCHATLNLTINSFGNVFPCCAGFDQTKDYLFGNIADESIVDIADRINNDPIARIIVFRGIAKLLPIIEQAGVKLDGDFKGICQLCWTIFSTPTAVQALKDHSAAARDRALLRLAEALNAETVNPETPQSSISQPHSERAPAHA